MNTVYRLDFNHLRFEEKEIQKVMEFCKNKNLVYQYKSNVTISDLIFDSSNEYIDLESLKHKCKKEYYYFTNKEETESVKISPLFIEHRVHENFFNSTCLELQELIDPDKFYQPYQARIVVIHEMFSSDFEKFKRKVNNVFFMPHTELLSDHARHITNRMALERNKNDIDFEHYLMQHLDYVKKDDTEQYRLLYFLETLVPYHSNLGEMNEVFQLLKDENHKIVETTVYKKVYSIT